MKAWQYLVTVVLGAACLILALVVIKTGKANQNLQLDLQRQQMEFNNAQRVMQLGQSIVQDMGSVALRNEKMHKLLLDNGLNVQAAPAPTTPAPKKAAVTP